MKTSSSNIDKLPAPRHLIDSQQAGDHQSYGLDSCRLVLAIQRLIPSLYLLVELQACITSNGTFSVIILCLVESLSMSALISSWWYSNYSPICTSSVSLSPISPFFCSFSSFTSSSSFFSSLSSSFFFFFLFFLSFFLSFFYLSLFLPSSSFLPFLFFPLPPLHPFQKT